MGNQMQFNIKLDCNLNNKTEYYQHQAALLAATKMYNNYIAVKDRILGTGPELFAEQWLHGTISGSDIHFENLILIYFTKILLGAQHGG